MSAKIKKRMYSHGISVNGYWEVEFQQREQYSLIVSHFVWKQTSLRVVKYRTQWQLVVSHDFIQNEECIEIWVRFSCRYSMTANFDLRLRTSALLLIMSSPTRAQTVVRGNSNYQLWWIGDTPVDSASSRGTPRFRRNASEKASDGWSVEATVRATKHAESCSLCRRSEDGCLVPEQRKPHSARMDTNGSKKNCFYSHIWGIRVR